MNPLAQVSGYLTHFQNGIIQDCLNKGSGGLSLPMGSGKTLVSLVVALNQTQDLILVVMAKSLIESWRHEIQKFFNGHLQSEVFHKDYIQNIDIWQPDEGTRVVLTTSDMIAKYYGDLNLREVFCERVNLNPRGYLPNFCTQYNPPTTPFLDHPMGGGLIFSLRWGCLLIDEIQKFTNIETKRAQGLGSICAPHRWGLSGTIFNEPKPQRILGYYLLLQLPDTPRNLPNTVRLIRSYNFPGIRPTLVSRSNNEMFVPPTVNEEVVSHLLSPEEHRVYLSMKTTLDRLADMSRQFLMAEDHENHRRFTSYILVMLTYLRQSLICPILPLASISINIADTHNKSELSTILSEELTKHDLDEWLDNENSIKSTRIQRVMETLQKHPDEKIVLFCSFRSCLDVLKYFLQEEREILTLESTMNMQRRGEVIQAFNQSQNAVFLLTYEIGAEGLNLQSASTVLILDFWWNAGKTNQAIARVLRFGQMAKQVNVYYYTSNTGMEKCIFQKQRDKLTVLKELEVGRIRSSVSDISMKEIVRMITDSQENTQLLQNVYS